MYTQSTPTTLQRPSRQGHRFAALPLLLLGVALLALAACGAVTGSPGSAGSGAPAGAAGTTTTAVAAATATSVAGARAPGSAQLNGCAEQQLPANLKTADVVVGQGGTVSNGLQVTLASGQVLEVRLPASVHWAASAPSASHILSAVDAKGWYDSAKRQCVWRFTAIGTGSTTLAFAGSPVCQQNAKCPALAVEQEFDVTVR